MKELNPLGRSFGGSPATVAYVLCLCARPRSVAFATAFAIIERPVILYLLDALVKLLFCSFFFLFVPSFAERLTRLDIGGPRSVSRRHVPSLKFRAGGIRTRIFRFIAGNLLPAGPRWAKMVEEGRCSPVELRPWHLRRDSNPHHTA